MSHSLPRRSSRRRPALAGKGGAAAAAGNTQQVEQLGPKYLLGPRSPQTRPTTRTTGTIPITLKTLEVEELGPKYPSSAVKLADCANDPLLRVAGGAQGGSSPISQVGLWRAVRGRGGRGRVLLCAYNARAPRAGSCRLLAAAGELEHFGEVGEGVALGEDVVRVSEERDGFVCQRLRFVVLSAPCEYFRLYPTRQDSGGRVVAGA